jgi:hypothetical protein
MTKIELRKYIETEDSLVPGDVIGTIEISDDGRSSADVGDAGLRERLQEILAGELTVRSGDPTGLRSISVARQVRAGDPAFVNALLELISGKELRLSGRVLGQA